MTPEQIRLEALRLAVARLKGTNGGRNATDLASEYEKYISRGDVTTR